jgi:DNA mismatch repair protein MLH1
MHHELTETFAQHTFVGVVDDRKRIVAVQSGVKLFLVDYGLVCAEYFYQLGLTDFGNFGSIRFEPPLDLQKLLSIGVSQARKLEPEPNDISWEEIAPAVLEQISSRREMLSEYFSLEVSEDGGHLISIPLMVKGYMPSMAKLPNFLLRLGPHVDWTDERACFHTFLRELADFYVPESLLPPSSRKDGEEVVTEINDQDLGDESRTALEERRKQVHRALENVLFPAFKTRLVATKSLLKGVIEIANLRGLYRVFERC